MWKCELSELTLCHKAQGCAACYTHQMENLVDVSMHLWPMGFMHFAQPRRQAAAACASDSFECFKQGIHVTVSGKAACCLVLTQ